MSEEEQITTVTIAANGPLLVKGPLVIRKADGTVIETPARVALCRCGHSENKPFCDGGHARNGFRDGDGDPVRT